MGAESKKRKVLIVSFHFAPANTSGAVRIGKFTKYLPEFGWESIVLTADTVKTQPQTLPLGIDETKVIRTSPLKLMSPLKIEPGNCGTSVKPVSISWRSKVVRGGMQLLRAIHNLPFFIGSFIHRFQS